MLYHSLEEYTDSEVNMAGENSAKKNAKKF